MCNYSDNPPYAKVNVRVEDLNKDLNMEQMRRKTNEHIQYVLLIFLAQSHARLTYANENYSLRGWSLVVVTVESRSVKVLYMSNPLHIHVNDSNGTSLITIKLTGVEHCRIWASAMKIAIQTKHKMDFINGSLSQDVYLGHVFSDNAYVVLNELKDTYDRVDGSIVFNLLQKINSFKQGGLRVSEYYHKLNSLWRNILTKLSDHAFKARAELLDHSKDSKLSVGFDETKCYIHDMKRERVLGTVSKSGALYVFDREYNKSAINNQSKDHSLSPNDEEGPSDKDGMCINQCLIPHISLAMISSTLQLL
nr:ribonuclease H-like domain-containing protein [Tanacetum cinerariifolium]